MRLNDARITVLVLMNCKHGQQLKPQVNIPKNLFVGYYHIKFSGLASLKI